VAARIVVPGAGGQVGRLLALAAAHRGYQVSALTREQWDIADPSAAERFIVSGDVVINCAAYTNVDGAEADPDAAFAINATGPANIADRCARVGARLVHISTDYVFAGQEPGRRYEIDDQTGPLSVYGQSKLAGDLAVLAALPVAQVVRTSWVYTGADGSDFVAVMRRLAATDRVIDVVANQAGSPTFAGDLVAALLEIVEVPIGESVVHAANDGLASWFDQAQAVFSLLGADPDRVRPVTTAQMPRPAPRPVCSALSLDKSVHAGMTRLRPWREALQDALAQPSAG
jgi:dTDP-4-dehydrorhamnose reductase